MKKLIFSLLATAVLLSVTSCKETPKQPQSEQTPQQETTQQPKAQSSTEVEDLEKPYSETEDAQAKIDELVALAKQQGKYVFVQAGGNWCIWCLRFNDFVQKNEELKHIVDQNYVYYHLNYSKNNKNKEVFDKYAPKGKEFGFPFFFVIDQNDQVTTIFGSEALESDKSYDIEKVKQVFLDNAPKK